MSLGLRGLGPLTRAYLLQSFRSRTAIFWNLVFPMVWLFLFGFVFYRGNPSLMMPGLFTITLISGAFFGVSYLMVSEREAGILRLYRVTPVSAMTVVLANAIRAMVTLSISIGDFMSRCYSRTGPGLKRPAPGCIGVCGTTRIDVTRRLGINHRWRMKRSTS